MNTLLTSILLGLVALAANLDWVLGGSMLARPMIVGTLTGLVMGDMVTGIIIGATIEMAFIGAFSIGAALPPDMVTGTILGTAFAISMNAGPEIAIPITLPIASLVLVLKNVAHVTIKPYFVSKADKAAEIGNVKGIYRATFWSGFLYIFVSQMLPVTAGFYFGADTIQVLLNAIPEFVMVGLKVSTGILPGFGLALLLKPMLNKQTLIFFLAGFVLTVYLDLPIIAVAFFGLLSALTLTGVVIPKELRNESIQTNYEVNVDEEF